MPAFSRNALQVSYSHTEPEESESSQVQASQPPSQLSQGGAPQSQQPASHAQPNNISHDISLAAWRQAGMHQHTAHQQQSALSHPHALPLQLPQTQANATHHLEQSSSLTCSDHPAVSLASPSQQAHASSHVQPQPRHNQHTHTQPCLVIPPRLQAQQQPSQTVAHCHTAAKPSSVRHISQPLQVPTAQTQDQPGLLQTVSQPVQGHMDPTAAQSSPDTLHYSPSITLPNDSASIPSHNPSLAPSRTPNSAHLLATSTPGMTPGPAPLTVQLTPRSRDERLHMEKQVDVDLMYKDSPVQWIKKKDREDKERRSCAWCRDTLRSDSDTVCQSVGRLLAARILSVNDDDNGEELLLLAEESLAMENACQ